MNSPRQEKAGILLDSIASPEIQGFTGRNLPTSSAQKDKKTRLLDLSSDGEGAPNSAAASSSLPATPKSQPHSAVKKERGAAVARVKRNIGAAFSPIKQRRYLDNQAKEQEQNLDSLKKKQETALTPPLILEPLQKPVTLSFEENSTVLDPNNSTPNKLLQSLESQNKQAIKEAAVKQPLSGLAIANPCILEVYIPHLKQREGMIVSQNWSIKEWKGHLVTNGYFENTEDFSLVKTSDYHSNCCQEKSSFPRGLDSTIEEMFFQNKGKGDVLDETFVAIKKGKASGQSPTKQILPPTPIKVHPLSQEAMGAFQDFSGLKPLILFDDEEEDCDEETLLNIKNGAPQTELAKSSENDILLPSTKYSTEVKQKGKDKVNEDLPAFLRDRTVVLDTLVLPGHHREGFQVFKSWTISDWKDWMVAKRYFPPEERQHITIASSGMDSIPDDILVSELDKDLAYTILSVAQ
mmetsp:Transcript_16639/g.21339  ORF Transcript_16639/g.21339 Transcript_16639/m.21339 type:complete len:464 (+) Transcript_16639:244-1635(+)